jgi:hypothetical protein
MVEKNTLKSIENHVLAWFPVNDHIRFYVLRGGDFALVDITTLNIIRLDKASLQSLAKILEC